VKKGDLYQLSKMADSFPHIQALFPYMQGGRVLVTSTSTTRIKSSKNEYTVEIIEFLFNGNVYSESKENFIKYATYIGGGHEHEI
jgi:hypothetical protein